MNVSETPSKKKQHSINSEAAFKELDKDLDKSVSPEPIEYRRNREADRKKREERRKKTSRMSTGQRPFQRQQGMVSATFVSTKDGLKEELETSKPRALSKYIYFFIVGNFIITSDDKNSRTNY